MFINRAWDLAFPLLAIAIAWAPMLAEGYPQGDDWIGELVRASEFASAYGDGQTIPFWASNVYYGFGAPVFIYYPPLFWALSGLFYLLLHSHVDAALATLSLFTGLGYLITYRFTRELLPEDEPGRVAAHGAAVLFTLSPYLLSDLILRNASAEYAALQLFLLPAWGVLQLAKGRRAGTDKLLLGLCAVILTHNLTALSCFALTLTAMVILLRRNPEGLRLAAPSVLFALLATAWFWYPALALKGLVQIDLLTQGKFDFHRNFADPTDFIGFPKPYSPGYLYLPLLLFAALIPFGRMGLVRLGQWARALLALAGLLLFLQTAASTLLWERIEWLRLHQFPWRFMGHYALVVALLGGLTIYLLQARLKPSPRQGVLLLGALLLLAGANAFPVLSQYRPLSSPIASNLDELLKPQQIRYNNLPLMVVDEYLPQGARLALGKRYADPSFFYGEDRRLTGVHERRGGLSLDVEVELKEPGPVTIARWHYPGWRAFVDGREVESFATPLGLVSVRVPAGRHLIEFQLGQPAERTYGLILAAFALLLYLALTKRRALQEHQERPGSSE